MAISSLLAGLAETTMKGRATVSKLDPSIRGKIVFTYGGNNLGKTKNAVKFPNPVVIPLEKGMNGTQGALVLKTATYTDVKMHVRTLTTNPQWLKALEQEPITIVIDGAEKLGLMCQRWLCQKYDVADISEGKGGYGLWGYYEKEIAGLVMDLTSQGYTILFIGHRQVDHKTGFITPKGDKRNIDPIIDVCDVVAYLTPNGVDENNQVIPSSAWLAETDQFFARSRFDYMDTYLETFSAGNLIEAIREGIQREIDATSGEVTDFAGQQEMYQSSIQMNHEETISALAGQYDQLANIDRLDVWEDVVARHLDGIPVSEAKPSQLENLHAIYNDLAEFLETAGA
jgi:hypothetical protein